MGISASELGGGGMTSCLAVSLHIQRHTRTENIYQDRYTQIYMCIPDIIYGGRRESRKDHSLTHTDIPHAFLGRGEGEGFFYHSLCRSFSWGGGGEDRENGRKYKHTQLVTYISNHVKYKWQGYGECSVSVCV